MKVTNSIEIHASTDSVWSVTTALERWPEWNPNVTEVARQDAGPLAIGSQVLVRQNGLPAAVWTVTVLEAKKRFAWKSRIRGVPMTATHVIEDMGPGARSRLELEATGFVALLLWPFLRPTIRRSIGIENDGLKTFCEKLPADQTAGNPHQGV